MLWQAPCNGWCVDFDTFTTAVASTSANNQLLQHWLFGLRLASFFAQLTTIQPFAAAGYTLTPLYLLHFGNSCEHLISNFFNISVHFPLLYDFSWFSFGAFINSNKAAFAIVPNYGTLRSDCHAPEHIEVKTKDWREKNKHISKRRNLYYFWYFYRRRGVPQHVARLPSSFQPRSLAMQDIFISILKQPAVEWGLFVFTITRFVCWCSPYCLSTVHRVREFRKFHERSLLAVISSDFCWVAALAY